MSKDLMIEKFGQIYGCDGNVRVFFAPGRVNLIGEHTDYNGGHVFPCALTIGTYAAIRKRDDKILRFYSMNFSEDGFINADIDYIDFKKEDSWANYPKGVISILKKNGFRLDTGFDMLIYGDLPNSSGLSSSASLEVVTAFALSKLYDFNIDMVSLAKICQQAENEFCGVNCGIMDQFAITMGKRNHAIFLDTSTLNYKYVPVILNDISLVICVSNKKRELNESKYNERRSECEAALKQLKLSASCSDIMSFGELDENAFYENADYITDELLRRRARHAVLENVRTIKAVDALNKGDINTFGDLMKQSHISLRDDYEVTGRELDVLYEASVKQEGVIGTRMTGAGFGGCSISLVNDNMVEDFIKNVGDEYLEKTGIRADFYTAEIGDGPVELYV